MFFFYDMLLICLQSKKKKTVLPSVFEGENRPKSNIELSKNFFLKLCFNNHVDIEVSMNSDLIFLFTSAGLSQ